MSLFLRALRKFLWNAYDHLGGLVALNLLWFALNLPWTVVASFTIFLGFRLLESTGSALGLMMICAGGEFALLSPPTAGMLSVTRQYAHGRTTSSKEIFTGLRRYFWRAQILGLLVIALTCVLLSNLYFYGQVGGDPRVVGPLLAGVMIWPLLALLLTALFLLPVLVSQDEGVIATLKYSALLSLSDPFFALILLIGVAAGLGAGAITGAGLLCGAISGTGLLASTAFREAVRERRRRAGIVDPDGPPEEPRSLRELIRPWE